MSDDLARQVAAARSGDREAFGRLYQRFGRMVHGILLAHGPREEAEDLVQDVFLRAWTSLGTLAPDAAGSARLVAESARLAELPDAVQVTSEPAGGSPAPRGAVIVEWLARAGPID